MTTTIIDIETWDPLLEKFGSGSVFKYHYPEVDFTVLGVGVKTPTEEIYLDFVNDPQAKIKLNKYMRQASIIVMHNAAYDLGCIKYLYKECKNIEKHLPIIHDTMLMAKLVYQQEDSYSLDYLAKRYECDHTKSSDLLHDYVWSSGLYQQLRKEKTGRSCHTRPSEAVLETFCKTHMHLIPANIVGEYCIYDLRSTSDLYYILLPLLSYYDLTPLNKIIKICLKSKFKGVRLDLNVAKKLSKQWKELAQQSKQEFLKSINREESSININSGEQIGPELEKLGIVMPRTLKGAYSITKDWLEEHGHPALKQLHLYRKAHKAEKD